MVMDYDVNSLKECVVRHPRLGQLQAFVCGMLICVLLGCQLVTVAILHSTAEMDLDK